MKRTLKAAVLAVLAVTVGVGVALAAVDFHPDGVGTPVGLVFGPQQSTPANDTIAFTGAGTVEAEGDLQIAGQGESGGVGVTWGGTSMAAVDSDATLAAMSGQNRASWVSVGLGPLVSYYHYGKVEAGTAGGQRISLETTPEGDGSATMQTTTLDGNNQPVMRARLALHGFDADLETQTGAAARLQDDGAVRMKSGGSGDIIVVLGAPD